MKPLGVVLLFLNLLAAAGVVYLATQNWSKRQEQNTALLKHELTISGVPLEKPKPGPDGKDPVVDLAKPEEMVPFVASPATGRTLTEIRAKVLMDIFTGAKREGTLFAGFPDAPPLSVIGELEAVKKQIDSKVAGFTTDPAGGVTELVGTVGKDGKLVPGLLTLLADDFEERFTYREWQTAARQGNAADYWALAKAALDRKFDEVLQPPKPDVAAAYESEKLAKRQDRDAAFDEYLKAKLEDVAAKKAVYDGAVMAYWKATVAKTAALSEGDRRRKAAGLMAVADPSAGGQKRTALTVGMADYTAAVLERTQRLSAMPERYEKQTEIEVANFEVVYFQKLATAQDLDRMLDRQTNITTRFAANEKQAKGEVALRTAHRDGAQGRVNDLTTKVGVSAADQEKLEADIFALQQLVGARFAELFELEDQVYKAEKQKAGK